ncbi:MAG: RcnB family protein [Ignavibacteria bacterium]
MKKHILITLGIAGLLAAAGPALADKPSWAGGGEKHGKGGGDRDHQEARDEGRHDRHEGGTRVDVSFRFDSDARRTIADYYGAQARGGHCPPGLAKKHNGCLPPGQAKKWQMGRPLPGDLRYYDLPRELVVRLPPPPPQHRYVQVAGDVLLIAVGSSMVVDAVQDILR